MATDHVAKPTQPDALILEAWGQGLMVGSLLIMAVITLANMKSHILLHKLIFAEVKTDPPIHSLKRLNKTGTNSILTIAHPCYGPRDFHLPQ